MFNKTFDIQFNNQMFNIHFFFLIAQQVLIRSKLRHLMEHYHVDIDVEVRTIDESQGM